MLATYLTKAPDGRAVRHLEDAVTRGLQIPQTVRAMTKLKALATLTECVQPQLDAVERLFHDRAQVPHRSRSVRRPPRSLRA